VCALSIRVSVCVAFAVLPLHTHSTLIDPTASSNKGFDFPSMTKGNPSPLQALSFALPSQPGSQSVNQSIRQSVSHSVSQSASQLSMNFPIVFVLYSLYCINF